LGLRSIILRKPEPMRAGKAAASARKDLAFRQSPDTRRPRRAQNIPDEFDGILNNGSHDVRPCR
jgi:hypothetical protein